MRAKTNDIGGGGMSYIRGESREQIYLLPEAIDDYVRADNPVRFLDAFVEQLDLAQLGFTHATPAETGRPPYDPGDLLRLYLYGYLNRIRSSRRLETEAGRNLELMWLLRKLRPDFKTIADFRKTNRAALKRVCREFTVLCQRLDLVGGAFVAIDGSKFRAVNGKARNFSPAKLQRLLKEIDAKIDAYLTQLDRQDAAEAAVAAPTADEMKAKLQRLQERKQTYEAYAARLQETGASQVSLTDPDSRKMPTRGEGSVVGYNVQVAVDEKYKLIVTHDVTNAVTDSEQLAPMAEGAKATLGVDTLTVVADMGYYSGADVKQCETHGMTVYVSKPNTSANTKLGLFGKERFRYDATADVYVCPAGQTLTYRCATVELGRSIRYYSTSACRTCELKPQCTRNKESRRISRWEDEAVLERMEQRVKEHPEIMRKRKMLVEHPFGTIKRWMDQSYFLLRGIEKVSAEASLTVLAYNMKRAINILGVARLVQALA
jgi:transposase